MKNARFLSMTTLALTLAAVLGVGMLAGCGPDATGDGASTEAQEQIVNDMASDEAADSDAAATEDAKTDTKSDATANSEPAWIVTHSVQTYKDAEGEFSMDTTYESDARGNVVKVTQDSDDDEPYSVSYEYDEDGFLRSMYVEGDETTKVTYTSEKDDQGRLVKITGSDETVQEYTYNKNGDIETSSYAGNTYDEDTEGNWVQNGTFKNVTTYDEEGFPVESVYDGEVKQTTKYTYERDENDKVVKMKTTVEYAMDDSEEPVVNEYESAVECDDNGNVVRVEELGEDYSFVTVTEYVEVADPSPWAKANARLKAIVD